ncbi:peptidoglycan-binding protein [Streptomyces sp. WMMB 322]|uniref:peptidoglycan-binding protein n=1 Tax=Streptomyces sp. WMMB 322 TaxID=1286821 RepID=UPI000823F744|nr:peptidoglycan-binding domain-containing protein [Streptomyces sp. WMMB 322]SCK40781.1 Putative peptidoglycan binding domain-containing protein [Streptomyces sp. WMMB 322]
MTAHRCCPECGAELNAGGGKFCGCAGPFTAEYVDPMHIRPYVDLPEPEDEGSQPPDLEPFARCGRDETAELPVVGPYDGTEPGEPAASVLPGEAGALPARAAAGRPGGPSGTRRGSHRRPKGRDAYAYGQDQGPGRRRGPAKAALAAAGVVAALGAGLLTTQTLSDGGGDDRSLSTDDTALPEIPDGGPTKDPSSSEKRKSGKKPSTKPTSRSGSGDRRADRDSDAHTDRDPVPSGTSSTAPGAPGDSEQPGNGRGRGGDHGRDRPRPPQEPTQPGGETLRPGDSGPEVAELQRRLKQAGALDEDAPEDGVYSQQVRRAVAEFQARNNVRGDDFGEYGPNTRRALESLTSG